MGEIRSMLRFAMNVRGVVPFVAASALMIALLVTMLWRTEVHYAEAVNEARGNLLKVQAMIAESDERQNKVRLDQFTKMADEINGWFATANQKMNAITTRRDQIVIRLAEKVGVPREDIDKIMRMPVGQAEPYPSIGDKH